MSKKVKELKKVKKTISRAMARDYDDKTGCLTLTFPCGCTLQIDKGERNGKTSMSWLDIVIEYDHLEYCDRHDPDTYQPLFEAIMEGRHREACNPQDGLCRCKEEIAEEGYRNTLGEDDQYELKTA